MEDQNREPQETHSQWVTPIGELIYNVLDEFQKILEIHSDTAIRTALSQIELHPRLFILSWNVGLGNEIEGAHGIVINDDDTIDFPTGDGFPIVSRMYRSENELSKMGIILTEPYMAWMWTMSFLLYENMLRQLEFNRESNQFSVEEMKNLSDQARQLAEYGDCLFDELSPWPQQLVDPTAVDGMLGHHVVKVNAIYIYAIVYVLAHEASHLMLGHHRSTTTDIERAEIEADGMATRLISDYAISQTDEAMINTIYHGSCIAYLALLIEERTRQLSDDGYPAVQWRLKRHLETLNLPANSSLWLMAAVVIQYVYSQLTNAEVADDPTHSLPRDYFRYVHSLLQDAVQARGQE